MWLRDSLPKDLDRARIMLYGYDSALLGSKSFQSMNDIGIKLSKVIRCIKEDHVVRKRTRAFIHSRAANCSRT